MGTVDWVRVNQEKPCPICARTHYCSVSADGGLVYCTKVESHTPGADGVGWIHKLKDGWRVGEAGTIVPAGHAAANGHAHRPGTRACRPTTRYAVVDAGGSLEAVHCRVDLGGGEKRIWWELPDGTRGLGGRKPETLPLYGADLLVEAPAGAVVFVGEGEKSTDALRGLGVHAVGTVTGAGTVDQTGRVTSVRCPTDEVLRPLVGYDVVLWPDNDEVGRRHMRAIARRLLALGGAARVLAWPDAPEKGDAADFVAAGLGKDELRDLYRAAAVVEESDGDEDEAEPEPGPLADLHLTDMGNAERLIGRHGPDLRYCGPWKRWVVWGGETWSENGDDRVQERAKETVRSIYEEGIAASNPERAQALWKHAQRSESAGKVRAMVELARSAPALAVAPDDLDRDPWLLNCANGTVDLRTGLLLPFTREDLMTKRSPALFDAAATCPTWLAFLDQIFGGDAEVIGFMQRSAGYCLSGSTAERVMFILFGAGRNGKSTFLEVLRHVMGDYASGTPASTIMSQRNKGIPNDIARLKGARFVSASETSEGAEIDEAFIKVATGGDTITARFLNAEFFDFRPQFKIWLATNHKPSIKGTDPAVWDRIRLVPFTVRIPDDELDKGLRDKLIAEADGILGWMVAGCRAWRRRGALGEPEVVRLATEEYRLDEDVLKTFLEDCCIEQPLVFCPAADLYRAYQSWAKGHGEEVMSQTRFGSRLRERGFRQGRSSSTRGWVGIRLYAADNAKKQPDGLE